MSMLMSVTSTVGVILGTAFGLILVGLGIAIWAKGHVRIGGLLLFAGVAYAATQILTPVLYSVVAIFSVGPDSYLALNVVFATARLLYWGPLIAALVLVLRVLPKRV